LAHIPHGITVQGWLKYCLPQVNQINAESRPKFTIYPDIIQNWPQTTPYNAYVSQTKAKLPPPLTQNSATTYPEAPENSHNWANIIPESSKLNQKLSLCNI